MLKLLWKRGEIAPKEQFLLLSTIFCYLMLDFYAKTRIRFSLRGKRLLEITEIEITRVDCIIRIRIIIINTSGLLLLIYAFYFFGCFQFEVEARDGGSPSRSSLQNARVTVIVVRNDNPPYFVNLPYEVRINETVDTTLPFFRVLARDNDTTVGGNICTTEMNFLVLDFIDVYTLANNSQTE